MDASICSRETLYIARSRGGDAALCWHYCSKLLKLLTKLLSIMGKVSYDDKDGLVLQVSVNLAVKCKKIH